MAEDSPGTLPGLRTRDLVSMTTPTAALAGEPRRGRPTVIVCTLETTEGQQPAGKRVLRSMVRAGIP